jgi:guanylate kinase
MRGKVIIFSAPSGSGKTTLVKWLLEQKPELKFSISATSRQPRGTEVNGIDYHFMTPERFRTLISENAFIEYEEVYPNSFYGTLKSEVENQLASGQHILFDVDVKGGMSIKKHFGDDALSIFVQPPSIEILEKRLKNRGTDKESVIRERIDKASYELTFAPNFDHIVVNDDLGTAKAECMTLVHSFLTANNS